MSLPIGKGHPPYIVAEISGNHGGELGEARALIEAAAKAGVNAVKLQTYTADTLTLASRKDYFKKKGGLWNGQYLHDLYTRGTTPWEWTKELDSLAKENGILLFSSPFDESAVDFLEKTINPPLHKIASYEITHLPLLKKLAPLGKTLVLSTGMATEKEIAEALETLKNNGNPNVILLKCISAYPTDPNQFNLSALPYLRERFGCEVGLSDHSLGNEVCLGAVALGACFIEKHIVLDRKENRIDSAFSLEPQEFKTMVDHVHLIYRAMGKPILGPTEQEAIEVTQRRSIFISSDIPEGAILNQDNIKVVRPAHGIEPKYWEEVLGKRASKNLSSGEPLQLGDWL